MSSPTHVIFIGNIGATNVGDEAILEGILQVFKEIHPTTTPIIFSANPEETQHRYHRYTPYVVPLVPAGIKSFFRNTPSLIRQYKLLKKAQCAFLGGGGLFTDTPHTHAVFIWTLQAWFVTQILRKPLHIIGQSVGPLKTPLGKILTSWVMQQAKSISVRDTQSAQLLGKLLPKRKKEIIVLTDSALFINPTQEKEDPHWKEHIPSSLYEDEIGTDTSADTAETIHVGISLRPWEQTTTVSGQLLLACKQLQEKYPIHLHLFPMQYIHEEDVKILEGFQHSALQLDIPSTIHNIHIPNHLIQQLQKMDLVIGMRLHFILLSLCAQTPALALPYSTKMTGILTDLGQEGSLMTFPPKHEEIVQKALTLLEKREKDKKSPILSTEVMKERQETFKKFMQKCLSSF